MQPSYEITTKILRLLTAVSELIGEVNATHLDRPSPQLRKQNKIKSIQATLGIEGNPLSPEQITAIIENKRVVGSQKDILEVQNAIATYTLLHKLNPTALSSFLKAHKLLMKGLVDSPGTWRKKAVGISKAGQLTHIAPPAKNLPFLMKDLFAYLKTSEDPVLIKSCVAHYEIEFTHPFMDGNGRMGRLWQTLLLSKDYPVFEHLPFETIIKSKQKDYYKVLSSCDKSGQSTLFIEFMLQAIYEALSELADNRSTNFTAEDRIEYYSARFSGKQFSRKEYMRVFKKISSATASRDLQKAVTQSKFRKSGDKRLASYSIK